MKPIIKVENVWKTYKMGDVYIDALKELNFEAREGEFIAIMGKSGSGKSTSMHLIGCLDVPTKGNIFLDQTNIAHLHESELAQIRGKKIGFIFQQFNLINTLSALENVTLPMIFQGIPKDERTEKAEKLLKLVELENRLYHRPGQLSGGESQRVAIARALSNNPDIILADEPTGNLDLKTGENVMKFLIKLNKENKKTIIIVTHDADVAKHAKRVCYLEEGRIIRQSQNGKIKNFMGAK